MTSPDTGAPAVVLPSTQERHPVRTILRGLVQWVPPIAIATPLVIAAVEDGNAGLLGPVGVGIVALATAVTRVMAIPNVNALLARAGLAADPVTMTAAEARRVIDQLEQTDQPGRHSPDAR